MGLKSAGCFFIAMNAVLLTMCIFGKWAVFGHQIKNFIEASELRSMLTNEHVLKMVDLSEVKVLCARLCSRDSNCLSFFENSVSQQCRLIDTKLNISQMSLTGAKGWQYYVPHCPKSRDYIYHISSGLCYKYFNIRSKIPEARALCESEGGQLLQIKSAEDHAVIADYLNSVSPIDNPTVDGERSDNDSPFLYYDGTAVTYFSWPDGEPAADKHCFRLMREYDFNISTTSCNRIRSFLCQILT